MERDTATTPSDLNRADGNSLVENYESHDVLESHVRAFLRGHGFTVEQWGVDMRYDDGSDGIIYDDAMDFVVYEGGNTDKPRALIDVKSKTSPKWLGMFNERHYENYRDHADASGIPTFVVMGLIDGDHVVDLFVIDVATMDPLLSSKHDAVSVFPDGNHKCVAPHEHRHDLSYLLFRMNAQQSNFSRSSERQQSEL